MTDEEILQGFYDKFQTMNQCHVSERDLKRAGYSQTITMIFHACGNFRVRSIPHTGRVQILKVTPEMLNKQQKKHDGNAPLPIPMNKPVLDLKKSTFKKK